MQKGKQTSQIRLPISFRLIELLQTIERFGSRVERLRYQFSQFSRSRSSFLSRVRQLISSEKRAIQKRIQAERRQTELQEIGRRLIQEN